MYAYVYMYIRDSFKWPSGYGQWNVRDELICVAVRNCSAVKGHIHTYLPMYMHIGSLLLSEASLYGAPILKFKFFWTFADIIIIVASLCKFRHMYLYITYTYIFVYTICGLNIWKFRQMWKTSPICEKLKFSCFRNIEKFRSNP